MEKIKNKFIGIFVIFIMLFSFSNLALASYGDTKILSVELLNQDPDPAIAGDTLELRIGIENKGGVAIEDLVVEINPEYPFSLLPGEDSLKEVGTIDSFQVEEDVKIIKYKLRLDKDATYGSYDMNLKVYEKGNEETASTKTIEVEVKTKESAEIIYIDKVELIPGQITPMKFTITNVGSSPLKDISFNWENEEDVILPVGSDNTKYVKYLDVGQDEVLEFEVIASANADPDLYKLDLTLAYEDSISNEVESITTKAGVYVGGTTDFDVAYSGSSDGEYSFSIANIGSVSATSVTVKVPKQSGWTTSGSNSDIIGNLNKGDYTISSFTLQSQVGNSGVIQRIPMEGSSSSSDSDVQVPVQKTATDNVLTLEITYTDSRGNRHTVEKEVEVSSSSSSLAFGVVGTGSRMGNQMNATTTSSSVLTNPLLWGGVLVAGVIILLYFKKRKKRK